MKITSTKRRLVAYALGLFGICALVGGSILLGLFENIVRLFLQRELILKPGNEFYSIWSEIPLPIYQKVYIFNITNPDEFSNGSKPILQEIGPYVFRGRWAKENMDWNEEDGTVTYKDIKDYSFVPELSVGDQEEMIYTLNAPLLAVIYYIEDNVPLFLRSAVAYFMNGIYDSYTTGNEDNGTVTYKKNKDNIFVPELLVGDQEETIYAQNAFLLTIIKYIENNVPLFLRSIVVYFRNGIFDGYNEKLLVHKTVREIIYEGYHEPMVSNLVQVAEPFINLPLKLVNDTFGILHERKHVGDGVFTIKSGVNGLGDYASIQLWNNKSSVNWWNDDVCDRISGTDGVQFAPGVTRNQILSLFNPNLCRSVNLKYERDITVHGIKALRFGMPQNTFASGDVNPENECYCKGSKCRSGILPMNCKKGAPYVLSLPHFLDGESELADGIHGMRAASVDEHKTYIDVEPVTGLVLNAAFRIQLNGVTRHLPDYNVLKHVSEAIVPVIWMSEEAQLDNHFANYFKSRVQTPLLAFRVVCIGAVVIGAMLTISSAVFWFCIEAKVKPESLKYSLVLKTLNSLCTTIAVKPPKEDPKESHASGKPHS